MWKCPKCGESVEDDFDVCWNCQTGYDGSSSHFSSSPSKDLDDLRARISAQSTTDLKRIVNVDYAEYRADAIDIAKAELKRRGVDENGEPKSTDTGVPPTRTILNARPTQSPGSGRNDRVRRVLDRYGDAYRIARFMVTLGTAIKVVGAILGALIAFTFMSFAGYVGSANLRGQTNGAEAAIYFVGFLWGGVVFIVFFIGGVIISAQGQILKANLDSAVHTSPFVTDDQKAQIMSLD